MHAVRTQVLPCLAIAACLVGLSLSPSPRTTRAEPPRVTPIDLTSALTAVETFGYDLLRADAYRRLDELRASNEPWTCRLPNRRTVESARATLERLKREQRQIRREIARRRR